MRTLVVGMGASGVETARFLARREEAFDLYDEKKTRESLETSLGPGSWRLFANAGEPDLAEYGRMVISPGISIRHELLERGRGAGLELIGEVELAFRHRCGRVVAITGTNGKSTTTALIHHILAENGFEAVICGNFGTPFIAVADSDPNKVYVVEISSFQMEHVRDFQPEVGVLLNLAPDHLDRHGSFEAYRDAKLVMFARQNENQLAVIPGDFETRIPGSARIRRVPGEEVALDVRGIRVGNDFELPAAEIPLLGSHNWSNLAFACAAVAHFGVDAAGTARALCSFKGLDHRFEAVGSFEGRLWVNDSKATNVHATRAAILSAGSLARPYALILGGSDKGERFHELDFGDRPPLAIVAYGQTAPQILEDLAAYHPLHVPLFGEACRKAHELAGENGVVLLSPACASYDQFANYMARGTEFRRLFHELEAGA